MGMVADCSEEKTIAEKSLNAQDGFSDDLISGAVNLVMPAVAFIRQLSCKTTGSLTTPSF